MANIITILKNLVKLNTLIPSLCNVISQWLSYKTKKMDTKALEDEKKAQKEKIDDMKDIADNGTLNDLLKGTKDK